MCGYYLHSLSDEIKHVRSSSYCFPVVFEMKWLLTGMVAIALVSRKIQLRIITFNRGECSILSEVHGGLEAGYQNMNSMMWWSQTNISIETARNVVQAGAYTVLLHSHGVKVIGSYWINGVGEMCYLFLNFIRIRAAAFWISWSYLMVFLGRPVTRALQLSTLHDLKPRISFFKPCFDTKSVTYITEINYVESHLLFKDINWRSL